MRGHPRDEMPSHSVHAQPAAEPGAHPGHLPWSTTWHLVSNTASCARPRHRAPRGGGGRLFFRGGFAQLAALISDRVGTCTTDQPAPDSAAEPRHRAGCRTLGRLRPGWPAGGFLPPVSTQLLHHRVRLRHVVALRGLLPGVSVPRHQSITRFTRW